MNEISADKFGIFWLAHGLSPPRPFDMLDELKARLPAGWSPERFERLLDDDIKEQSQQGKTTKDQ